MLTFIEVTAPAAIRRALLSPVTPLWLFVGLALASAIALSL